jgi:hypothetical protein
MSAVFFDICADEGQRQFSSQSMTTAADCKMMSYESHGARNQESLCWRGPATILQSLPKLRRNERSAYTERPTPPLAEGKVPLLNTYMAGRENILVIDLDKTRSQG